MPVTILDKDAFYKIFILREFIVQVCLCMALSW